MADDVPVNGDAVDAADPNGDVVALGFAKGEDEAPWRGETANGDALTAPANAPFAGPGITSGGYARSP